MPGWLPVRRAVLIYDLLILGVLLAGAAMYAFEGTLIAFLMGTAADWFKFIVFGIWFGMLGSIAISIKGVADHGEPRQWEGKWPLWYVARPFSGVVVGSMTYVLLRMANTAAPSLPALALASFIFGTQEARFFGFLSAVGKLVLSVADGEGEGVSITKVVPDAGRPGETVLVVGNGFAQGAVASIGGVPIENAVVSPDGCSVAGRVPAGNGLQPVTVTNIDGSSAAIREGFKIES